MTNVATASKEQVDWAIGVIDQAGEGEEVDGNDFFKASAVLTVVSYAAFELAEEVEAQRLMRDEAEYQLKREIERLQLVFAFHCSTGALSIAQVATALNMSQAEVKELMKKLPSPASRSQASESEK